MKKIICTAVSALALAAFADGVNSTEFGVLYVPSSAKETIVSVPWFESGTGTSDVSVSNLVLTAGLKSGDTLTLYGDGAYTASWYFNGTTWVKSDPGDDTLPRGKALMLKRDNPGAGFYIMGKPASSEAGSTTAVGGTSTAPGFSLVAPSRTQDTDVGDLTVSGGTSMEEYIVFTDASGALKVLTYTSKGWYNPKTKAYNDVTIPAGQGVWFRSSSSGEKTISWN